MTRPPASYLSIAGFVLGAALVALLPASLLFHTEAAHNHEAEAATGERWACPMMDFIGNRPGNCPVCGMQMTKVTAGELTREQQRRMGLELATIEAAEARAVIRAYGTVRYDDRTLQVVIPRVAGRVVQRHAAAQHVGTMVQAGDPVVDLYSPEAFSAQGELAAAVKLGDQPTIRALEERFERWNLAAVAQRIVAGGAPTDTITISSPFSGRVVLDVGTAADPMARLPQVGQEVMADTALVRVVDPDSFILVVQVPEQRAHWVRVGQAAHISSDDRGDLRSIQAEIAWVAPELNREIRAREVHVHLEDPAGLLLPGSLVNARFSAALGPDLEAVDPATESAGTFTLVPKTAILSTGVRHVAWKVAEQQKDGRLRFELAPVALGPRIEDASGNDVYVVRAGLQPGDRVATEGAFLIDSQAQLAGTPSLLFPAGATAAAPTHQH